MEKYLEIFIDDRNREMWESLSKTYNITLHQSDEPNYKSRLIGNNFEIHIDENDITPESFTHELLHLHLKSKGVLIQQDLNASILPYDNISKIFSIPLIEHINNCLEHNKMLPKYLELGYDNSKFISDYSEIKITKKYIEKLKESFKVNGKYYREAFDVFIGKFFAMKSDNNPKHRYYEFYVQLKKIDPTLYKLLSDFWEDWLDYDINNPEDTYNDILEYFIDDLIAWAENKEFF